MKKNKIEFTLMYEEYIKLHEEEETSSSIRDTGKKYKEAGKEVINIIKPKKNIKSNDDKNIKKEKTKREDNILSWDEDQKTSLSKLEHEIYNKTSKTFNLDSKKDTINPLSVKDDRLWDEICKNSSILNKTGGNMFIDKYYDFIIYTNATTNREKYKRFGYMFKQIEGLSQEKFKFINKNISNTYRTNFLSAGIKDDDIKLYTKK